MMIPVKNIQKYFPRANYIHPRLKLVAGMLVAVMTLTSCHRTRFDKGYEYFPDMSQSLAYETYAPNGKTGQLPVKGAIPREMIPYQYLASEEGRKLAGLELVNPVKDSMVDMAKGKELYTIFCIDCHGTLGDGKGHLFTSGKYAVPPASLLSAKTMAVPAGEIFHVITVGYNVMGAHGPQIRPDDRWQIVNYVQAVLQKKNNK